MIPKRILVINSEYPPIGGGAGHASANLARCLAALGHDVVVLTARFEDLPQRETHGGVTVHRIRAWRHRQDRSSALEQLSFIASATWYSLRFARRFRPDASLAFFGMPSGAVAWLLKKVYRTPYVVSLRGGDVPGFRPYDFKTVHRMMGPFLRVIWHTASSVVANSRGLRELARAFDTSIDIPIIPNGVDVARHAALPRAWTPPRLLSVGRVVYQKGLDLGLRALAELKDLPWEWCIAGDGPQVSALRSLARELSIAERVTFLGWQAPEELAKSYQSASLFLFPSRHEGMPNAVLEAMASGLPVVATEIAGNDELVLDGETGRLVPTEDPDALRESLRGMLSDPRLCERMGHAARCRVEQRYLWVDVARQYETILGSAAGNHSGPRRRKR